MHGNNNKNIMHKKKQLQHNMEAFKGAKANNKQAATAKQLLLNTNKRMLNRNQFVQNSKLTLNSNFGQPDNYSFN